MGCLGSPLEDKCQSNIAKMVLRAASVGGVRLIFRFQLCEQTSVQWRGVLVQRSLYLRPGASLPDGSKDSFVALLEYAEECLQCKHIFVCLSKSASDCAAMVRTFMFLGFLVVPPGHPSTPAYADYFTLLYTVDGEDSSDDEGQGSDSDGDVFH